MKFPSDAILYGVMVLILFQYTMSYSDSSHCSLWVEGTPIFDITDENGNPRYNPDHTLYPNDAFSFVFRYYFADTCISPYVNTIQDTGSVQKGIVYGPEGAAVSTGHGTTRGTSVILVGEANICHGAPPQGGGGTSGYESDFGEPKDCGNIQLTIQAYSRICTDTCRLVLISRTATITPEIVAPIVHINLDRHMLYDTDGYPAINLDTTYYTWDPISIEHTAIFEHGDARSGTISFRYDMYHNPTVIEAGFSCDAPCHRTLHSENHTGIGFEPYRHIYGNGGGMYVYTAPSLNDIGIHDIVYDVDVMNMGIPINLNTNHTDIEIVPYLPNFEHYSYGVLSDGSMRSYGNRHGIMMEYMGSGDTSYIQERRAKITGFFPDTVAVSESALVPPYIINHTMMHWNSTWALHPTKPHYDRAVLDFYDKIHGYNKWPDNPYHTTSNDTCTTHDTKCHVMFMYTGYGIIRFSQDITDVILVDNPHKWYHNVTISNKIKSDMWAGHTQNDIIEYTYVYPHTELSNMFYVNKPNGSLRVQVTPVYNPDETDMPYTTIPIDRYIREKTLHDTGNDIMSDMHVLETHDTEQYTSGTGHIQMRLNKTALTFWHDMLQLYNYTTPYDIPIHEALEYESHLNVTVSYNDMALSRVILYEFDIPYNVTIYHGQPLNVTVSRHQDTISLVVPEQFGAIYRYTIHNHGIDNFTPHGRYCQYVTCHIDIPRSASHITIYNEWNDTYQIVIPPPQYTTHDTIQFDTDIISWIIPIAITCILTYCIMRRYVTRYENA